MLKSKFSLFCFLIFLITSIQTRLVGQVKLDSLLPVRGFAIAAPSPSVLDSFITFIEKELAPRGVNTLILRVDYNYQFKSHPELAEQTGLSTAQVKRIVRSCKQNKIRIIPQINLLGHQSWANEVGKLL
jgi:hypothetical protein